MFTITIFVVNQSGKYGVRTRIYIYIYQITHIWKFICCSVWMSCLAWLHHDKRR